MHTSLTILKLLYSSSNWLLRISYGALPVALFLSVSAFLFIDDILRSYEAYLIRSYIGAQGRVSVTSKDERLVDALFEDAKKKGYKASLKKEIKANLFFQNGENKILKYAKFILLDPEYMKTKFGTDKVSSHTLFVNEVFANSVGGFELDGFRKLYRDKDEQGFVIGKIIKVQTGFLSSEPLVFLPFAFGEKIFSGDKKRGKKSLTIEYLVSDPKYVADIKSSAERFAARYHTLQYMIHDLIEDTKETRSFFTKISIAQVGISLLIFVLTVGIVLLCITIAVEFRRNSLKILRLLGMSIRELSMTLSGALFLVMCVVLMLSLAMQPIFRELFVEFGGFSKSFFVNTDFLKVGMMMAMIAVVYVYIFYKTKHIFLSSTHNGKGM